jgi:nitrile hydratase accessory protein
VTDIHRRRPEEPTPQSGLPDCGTLKVSKSATADFDLQASRTTDTNKIMPAAILRGAMLGMAPQDEVHGFYGDLTAAQNAARSVPGISCDAEGPVFREPWEAEAFAMAVVLHQHGLFGWDEWAKMLGEEIKAAQAAGDPDTGETYYRHWLAVLERMVAHKGIADRSALARCHDAWKRAADRTPHGAPIELTAKDFAAK